MTSGWRALCLASAGYDAILSLLMLFGQSWLAGAFGIAPLNYPATGQLNGLFVGCVAAGYGIPLRGLQGGRLYLWVFGVALKLGGVLLFASRVALWDDPPQFLLFALCDGLLGLWTLVVLRWSGRAAVPAAGGRDARPTE
jgi:hypothetical protein